jgi:hypothetical protein|tara:strand:- start:446 stop:799 length:354 start_codon:yes stop_codon:yes gene_type:complete
MSEERLQAEVIKWINLKYPKIRFCASLGGIYTSPRQAIKAKRTGYKRGFPDLQITEARGGYFGLFIELKTIKGRATEAQKEWIQDLNDRGYKAEICKGLPATLKVIDAYMNQQPTMQ